MVAPVVKQKIDYKKLLASILGEHRRGLLSRKQAVGSADNTVYPLTITQSERDYLAGLLSLNPDPDNPEWRNVSCMLQPTPLVAGVIHRLRRTLKYTHVTRVSNSKGSIVLVKGALSYNRGRWIVLFSRHAKYIYDRPGLVHDSQIDRQVHQSSWVLPKTITTADKMIDSFLTGDKDGDHD